MNLKEQLYNMYFRYLDENTPESRNLIRRFYNDDEEASKKLKELILHNLTKDKILDFDEEKYYFNRAKSFIKVGAATSLTSLFTDGSYDLLNIITICSSALGLYYLNSASKAKLKNEIEHYVENNNFAIPFLLSFYEENIKRDLKKYEVRDEQVFLEERVV